MSVKVTYQEIIGFTPWYKKETAFSLAKSIFCGKIDPFLQLIYFIWCLKLSNSLDSANI